MAFIIIIIFIIIHSHRVRSHYIKRSMARMVAMRARTTRHTLRATATRVAALCQFREKEAKCRIYKHIMLGAK